MRSKLGVSRLAEGGTPRMQVSNLRGDPDDHNILPRHCRSKLSQLERASVAVFRINISLGKFVIHKPHLTTYIT